MLGVVSHRSVRPVYTLPGQLKWKRYEQEGNDDLNITHLNIETFDDKEQVKL
jgi:hypothetical protein